MKHTVRDWLNVLVILIFAPFFLGILYMALSSSVVGPEEGLVYIYIVLALFVWVLINTILGYTVNKEEMTVSFPYMFNFLRRKADLAGLTCFDIVGFSEEGVSNNSVGFHKFQIILRGEFGAIGMVFNREDVARKVYGYLKEAAPKIGVREGSCPVV